MFGSGNGVPRPSDDDNGNSHYNQTSKARDNCYPKGRDVHNPIDFPAPDVYNPSRFLDEVDSDMPMTIFGTGPRACLGRKFAMTEMVCFIALFLRDWKVDVVPEDLVNVEREALKGSRTQATGTKMSEKEKRERLQERLMSDAMLRGTTFALGKFAGWKTACFTLRIWRKCYVRGRDYTNCGAKELHLLASTSGVLSALYDLEYRKIVWFLQDRNDSSRDCLVKRQLMLSYITVGPTVKEC
ncbi:hypothetical protein BKA82DRAFT_7848 [Pisolithus tinctorius]|uniref:Cytochrome P450 n=1 Tax=Pisolithus tinctorius Marx 270 TaxID=870435 RepID=A0A0C3PM89_PISTI|nr:hypothetical protein BKA82DRAFT_7848 [Pisolithus tinctorius]KIO09439.1 hypothetical protein M404DRAFT_7848 [Pisolithus tinctorius Marx 270]